MTWEEFDSTVVRRESSDAIELDVRPFGHRQAEAVDFWLGEALKQGDTFGKTVTLKTDASAILSSKARADIGELRAKGILVNFVGER